MFERELSQAVREGQRMSEHLRAASEEPSIGAVARHLHGALEAAWRMESALGQFLAVEEPKLRAAGLVGAATAARQAFESLRPSLADADGVFRRPEAEMKAWIERFRRPADEVVAAASEALRAHPPARSSRVSQPVGEARPDRAAAIVSIARTTQRGASVEAVENLVREALAPLGGIGRFVRSGQTVLLKPNQTLAVLADEGSTTDPRVVAALTRLCLEAGAARVIVGESAGGGSRTTEVMRITGITLLARRAGAEVIDFHACPQREVEIPNGKAIKRILLPAPILDADVVINLPKLKTHNWDWISGALKNWVGIVRPDVRSAHHDAATYDEYIDLLFRVPAQLIVMDGLVRGVGNGPGANRGEFYGGVLASTDPVALDAVAAQVLGFDPGSIGFVRTAAERGLGIGDPRRIAVVGYPLSRAVEPADPPVMGVDMFAANVIVGTGITRAGTLGHFKSMGDIFQAMSNWEVVRRLHGRPTILIGDAEDPLFAEHLEEGPYLVLDDAAPARYKEHPGVYFIPGHPVLHNLEKELLIGLKIPRLGAIALKVMAGVRSTEAWLEFNAPRPFVPGLRAAFALGRLLPIPLQVPLLVGTVLGPPLALGVGVFLLSRGSNLGRSRGRVHPFARGRQLMAWRLGEGISEVALRIGLRRLGAGRWLE